MPVFFLFGPSAQLVRPLVYLGKLSRKGQWSAGDGRGLDGYQCKVIAGISSTACAEGHIVQQRQALKKSEYQTLKLSELDC